MEPLKPPTGAKAATAKASPGAAEIESATAETAKIRHRRVNPLVSFDLSPHRFRIHGAGQDLAKQRSQPKTAGKSGTGGILVVAPKPDAEVFKIIKCLLMLHLPVLDPFDFILQVLDARPCLVDAVDDGIIFGSGGFP